MAKESDENNELDYMTKEQLNEIFDDIFELPEEDSVRLAYACYEGCGTAPSK